MAKGKAGLSLSDICHESGSEHQENLTKVIDEHVNWMLAWHQISYASAVSPQEGIKAAAALPLPKTFAQWFKSAAQRLPIEQPAIDRLAVLHDQLHKFARMVLAKAEGKLPSATDDKMVLTRFIEFMRALRLFERTFAAAVAGRDTMTAMKSRFALCDDLVAEQKRMARNGQVFCLALGDIDGFKSINHLHGEETGNRALIQVAECIDKTIRAYDDAYRVEADSFAICLKATNKEQAMAVIERLREAVLATKLRLFGGGQQDVTISFGLVEAKPDEDAAFLIYRAEQGLQAAKAAGGNCTMLGSDAPIQKF